MRRRLPATAPLLLAFCATVAFTSRAAAQPPRTNDDWCSDRWDDRQYHHCEVREATVPGLNPLEVDAGRNGGIRVSCWDRAEVHVRAKIVGYADSAAEARRVVGGVRIETGGNAIRAEGPDASRDTGWSVSFELQVPRTAMLTLHTRNGGISIADFRGTATFRATNGGVTLTNVGGDIRGETTNGGIRVRLSGDRWDGAGLDVETRNGGVQLDLPDNYSASLETGTVNGRVNIDFPVTVQGRINNRHLTTTLGSGGARVRAVTTNGGVTIRKRT